MVQEHVYSRNKLDFKTQGFNPQGLSSVLSLRGGHSAGPSGYKFPRSLCLELLGYT